MPKEKVGTVTYCDPASGAFIENTAMRNWDMRIENTQSHMPVHQVFVPRELLQRVSIHTGQLVLYREENLVATYVEPLDVNNQR